MVSSTLEISSDVVGNRSESLEIEVTPRMIMNYAAGIDDPNPWHFADDRPQGIVAPPMMTWALTWRFSVQRKKLWGGRGIDPEIGKRSVHYSEELEWSRPLRPGDKLTITGEIDALMSHRAGTVLKTKYVGVDAAGEHVFTERVGGMLRDVTCNDSINEYQNPTAGTDRSEMGARRVRIPIHPKAAHIYDGCADIHNPIHTSKAFALSVGLPDIILHGTATLAYAIREITQTEGGGDPRRIKSLACSFTGMVLMGTEVELQVLGCQQRHGLTDVFFQVVDQNGKKAIRHGRVVLSESLNA